jgi:hypothetical protein
MDNSFNNPNELKEHIISNIESFCENVLNVTLRDYKTNFPLNPIPTHDGEETIYADLLITDTSRCSHFIKFVCPQSVSDNLKELGQCMAINYYLKLFGFKQGGVYLVSSKNYDVVPFILKDNNSEIKYIYYEK